MTKRTLPLNIDAPTHSGETKPSVVMTETAIHTVELPEGHFAAIVQSNPLTKIAAISILDRAEVEAHIVFLRNAIEDAERLDAGLPARHAAHSLRRN